MSLDRVPWFCKTWLCRLPAHSWFFFKKNNLCEFLQLHGQEHKHTIQFPRTICNRVIDITLNHSLNFEKTVANLWWPIHLFFIIWVQFSPALTKCYKNQTLALTHSQFHHSNPFLKLKKPSLLSSLRTGKLRAQKPRSSPLVFAAQSNNVKG